MFKIYSLALLSFLLLQSSYAADEKEEFPGARVLKLITAEHQHIVGDLQQNICKITEYYEKEFCQPSNQYTDRYKEKIHNPEGLQMGIRRANELREEMKRVEGKLESFKENLSRGLHHALAEGKLYNQRHQEALKKEATKYRELGITSFLKGLDEENLPAHERSSGISLDTFPLTFDRPDKNNDRIYLRLSEEDWQSLRASGVNHELINNLFSHLQTDVSALYDMIQRGYRNRQEQNKQ